MLDSAGTWPGSESGYSAVVIGGFGGQCGDGQTPFALCEWNQLGGSTAISSWRPVGARPVAPRQIMLGVKSRGS